MTYLTREQLEALLDGSINDHLDYDHDTGEVYLLHQGVIAESVQPCDGPLLASAPDLARQLLATMIERDEAQAAQALVVERACLAVSEQADWPEDEHGRTEQPELFARVINAIRSLADQTGVKLLEEMRAERGRVAAINVKHCESVNTLLVDGARLEDRAKSAEADRDRLAAANAVLEAKVAGLREAVDEQTKARAQHWLRRTMTAPEDAEVEALCERRGYGAVMDAASRLWARKPHGSGAFYIGGCIGFKSDEEARAALATQEAGKDGGNG